MKKPATCVAGFPFLVRLAGIEPTTPWFVAKYSIQLSYSREATNYSMVFEGLRLVMTQSVADQFGCDVHYLNHAVIRHTGRANHPQRTNDLPVYLIR